MNRIYKVIYSKAHQCYVVVSELAKRNHKSSQPSIDHSTPALARVIAMALTAGALTWGSTPGISWAADKDIVKGDGVEIKYDISPTNDGTNIAVGKNAKVFIGGGTQESMLSFGEKADPTMWHGLVQTGWNIHSNEHAKKNLPEAIAIGTNSYARTGSIEIGAHTLAENKISIGDTTADQLRQFGVASTTLGTNSYTGGGFATTIGSYNVQTNQYEAAGLSDAGNATKNAFATVIGTFNSNESMTGSSSSGVANMISGTANKVTNSNGAIVMGAGNSAEKTQNSQIMGVGNSMKSTTYKKVQYNYLDGFNSSITDASHVKVLGQSVTINKGADSNTVIGDYRTVAEGQTHNVIIGNADETAPITTEKKDTVILGHNANAKVDGGVAIGSGSIANVEKGQKGYYVKHDQRSEEGQGYPFKNNDSAWISRAGAVSVGDTTNEDQSKWITRQITGVAAGTKDTDAVNVAQLKNSQTRFYSIYDPGDNWLGIFPQIPNWEKYKNEDNQGAQGYWSMAAGFGTSTGGIASTVIGSLSKIDDKWTDGKPNGFQGATAVSDGSLNSIESYKDAADNSGVASSIVGTANRIANSNNTTILGAGNEVTNSLTDIKAPTEGGDTAKALQGTLKDKLQQDTKGAVVVSGIGNKVDSSHGVSVLGSRNVVNTTDNIQLLGDNREVTGATGSVIIGSADSKTTTLVKDATILGHNANVEKEGGVALGAGSVASREAQIAGYDPSTKADSTDASATWKATNAAVSVGKSDGSMTRQITGVAAGTNATDAVNVAQLQKAMETVQASAETSDTDTHVKAGTYAVTTVKDATGKETQGVALDVVDKAGAPVGKVTITDVAKASDVGDVSKLATTSKTVVGAINDVNTKVDTVDKKVDKVDTKVGNLQYVAEGKAKVVANNDSVTTAIGKLDQAIGNASTEAGKHTVVSTEDANLTVKNIAKSGEAANYQLALSKDIKVDSVTTTKVTSDTVNTKNLSVSDAASIGDVTINKDG